MFLQISHALFHRLLMWLAPQAKITWIFFIAESEVIKVRVVTIDVSSIGIKFENFMQAGCRDLGSQPCTAETHHSAQTGTLF